MPNEYSSVKMQNEISVLEKLMTRPNSISFEDRLAGEVTARSQGYFKYPSDLLTDPSHQCIMRIQIYENDPQYLATKREVTARLANSLADSLFASQTSAEVQSESASKIDFAKIVSAGFEALSSGVGVIADTALQSVSAGDLRGTGRGRDSYTEEQTGVAGGTKKNPNFETIFLYMPTGLEVGYGMEYEDSSMAGMDNLKIAKAIIEGDAAAARDIGKKLGLANIKVLDKVGELMGIESGTFAKYMSAQQRQVVNPMSLHLFKEVKRRDFAFSYTFLPRNREEAITCYRIIDLLKFHAHPKRSEGNGRFLDYPAEFQISFIDNRGRENPYLPYIHKCVLKDIKVRYGEETTMATFEDPSGAIPTKIVLDLSFSELEILTQDRFRLESGNMPNP